MIKVIYYLVNRAIRSVLQARIPSGFREPVKNVAMISKLLMGKRRKENNGRREDGKKYSADLIFPLYNAKEQGQDIVSEDLRFSLEILGEEIVKITSPITPLTLRMELRDFIKIVDIAMTMEVPIEEVGMEIILPDEDEIGEERTMQLFISGDDWRARFSFLVKDIIINEKLIGEYRVTVFISYSDLDSLSDIINCFDE